MIRFSRIWEILSPGITKCTLKSQQPKSSRIISFSDKSASGIIVMETGLFNEYYQKNPILCNISYFRDDYRLTKAISRLHDFELLTILFHGTNSKHDGHNISIAWIIYDYHIQPFRGKNKRKLQKISLPHLSVAVMPQMILMDSA